MIAPARLMALTLAIVSLMVVAACGGGAGSTAQPTAAAPKAAAATPFPTAVAKVVATSPVHKQYSAPPPMTIDTSKVYVATIDTDKGKIVAELYHKEAPQHVNNFVFLAKDGFFDNLTFHRVEPGFVIQGGDPVGNGTGGPGYTIPAEISRKHTEGALAAARLGDPQNPKRESSGSQFYITLGPQSQLDGLYSVFGQVTQGLDVAKQIQKGDHIKSVTITTK